MTREWSYWTKNKLDILSGYLPAFNNAAKNKSDQRIYLDLMAGQAENVERHTGQVLDGSPIRALTSDPGFTRLAFFEMPGRAEGLERALRARFPDSPFDVYAGDSNVTVDAVLAQLQPYSWAPTFAFIDQQAAEIHWATIRKIAQFKRATAKTKAEIWLLVSPAMVAKGVRGTNNGRFRERVTRFYGTQDWLRIQNAREESIITAKEYRAEMVNLIRYRMKTDLGYRYTIRIPMQMHNKTEIYDMVFATDHFVGDKIMRYLYNAAAKREPGMMDQARQYSALKRAEKTGQGTLFDPVISEAGVSGETLWQPDDAWDPSQRSWW